MEKETKGILKIITDNDGYSCGVCKPCRTIEEKIDKVISKLKTQTKSRTTMPLIYYCEKCNRYTDVRYIQDKFGGRPKSFCYKCQGKMLIPVEAKQIESTENREDTP